MGRETPNYWVDVTDMFELKKAALLCHVSQLPKPAELEPMLRSWLTMQRAEPAGCPRAGWPRRFTAWKRPEPSIARYSVFVGPDGPAKRGPSSCRL